MLRHLVELQLLTVMFTRFSVSNYKRLCVCMRPFIFYIWNLNSLTQCVYCLAVLFFMYFAGKLLQETICRNCKMNQLHAPLQMKFKVNLKFLTLCRISVYDCD